MQLKAAVLSDETEDNDEIQKSEGNKEQAEETGGVIDEFVTQCDVAMKEPTVTMVTEGETGSVEDTFKDVIPFSYTLKMR